MILCFFFMFMHNSLHVTRNLQVLPKTTTDIYGIILILTKLNGLERIETGLIAEEGATEGLEDNRMKREQ